MPSKLPHLRWWIGGLLFASTVINFIDRQTLSVLAPYLKLEYHWTNTDFATVLIAFRIAYTIGQSLSGRLLDKVGTRRGLSYTVTFYCLMAMLTATARGLFSFRGFRFLLGAGESGNWPGAAKAVSEWFPDRERALAVALYDSGSSIGGAIAPFLVLGIYQYFGSWRPAFIVTGSLGFLWLIAWHKLYHRPEDHPRISAEELAYIQAGKTVVPASEEGTPFSWHFLLSFRQTWGIVLTRFLLDPYWFFMSEWFPLYLMTKGYSIEQSILGYWAPFLGADLGNFFGGGLSSYWVKKGWPVGRARRTVILIFGPSMLLLMPAILTTNYILLIALFSYVTFAYAACATIFLASPADVFDTRAVGSVSGLSGTGAGIGTLFSTYMIGRISDQHSFEPIIIAGSLIPCLATVIFLTMVRSPKQATARGILREF